MAISAKDIRVLIMKFLWFSAKTVCKCVQKHPLLSGMLLVFFLLHLLFPFAFILLVCSTPFFLGGYVIYRLFFSGSPAPKTDCIKREGKSLDRERELPSLKSGLEQEGTSTHKFKKPYISAQMSKRRNFKAKLDDPSPQGVKPKIEDPDIPDILGLKPKLEDQDILGIKPQRDYPSFEGLKPKIEDPSLQVVTKIKHVEFSLFPDDNHGSGSSYLVERKEKIDKSAEDLAEDENESSRKDQTNLSDPDSLTPKTISHSEADTSSYLNRQDAAGTLESDILEEAEDEDEEDQAHDDGNRVVEWNENDQKNLMDLGFSELERNRRLENLIAKRRARKFLMAVRASHNLLDNDKVGPVGDIPTVHIAKGNPFELPNGPDEFPGSAPSVLLPGRNPFDLPYDPMEEKPNLTVDGFQQEFLGTHQPKDIFCRHESFTLGPSFLSDIYQDQDSIYSRMERIVARESRFSRLRIHPDKGAHDRFVEQILYRDNLSEASHDDDTFVERGAEAPLQISKPLEIGQVEYHSKQISNSSTNSIIDECSNARLAEPNPAQSENFDKSSLPEGEDDAISTSSSSKSEDSSQTLDAMNNEEQQDSGSVRESPNRAIPVNGNFYGTNQCFMAYISREAGHSATYSIASDMQVEVSEPSSPPNIPSPVLSSSSVGDMEEDINFESQEPVMVSFRRQQGEEPGSTGITQEQDVIEMGPSSEEKNTVSDKMSASSSSTTIGALDQSHSSNSNNNNNISEGNNELRGMKNCSFDSLEVEIPEEEIHFVDNSDSMAHPADGVPSEKSEELTVSSGSSSMEIKYNPAETLETDKEETENLQPSAEDGTEIRNNQHNEAELGNRTEQDAVSHTRRADEENINPFAKSTGDAAMIYNVIGPMPSHANDDKSKESGGEHQAPVEQVKSLVEETRGEPRASIQEVMAEPVEESQRVSEAPIEQVKSEPVEDIRRESPSPAEQMKSEPVGDIRKESQAPVELVKSEAVEENRGVSQSPDERVKSEPVKEGQEKCQFPIEQVNSEPVEIRGVSHAPVKSVKSETEEESHGGSQSPDERVKPEPVKEGQEVRQFPNGQVNSEPIESRGESHAPVEPVKPETVEESQGESQSPDERVKSEEVKEGQGICESPIDHQLKSEPVENRGESHASVEPVKSETVEESKGDSLSPNEQVKSEPVKECQGICQPPLEQVTSEPVEDSRIESQAPTQQVNSEPIVENPRESQAVKGQQKSEKIDMSKKEAQAPIDQEKPKTVGESQGETQAPIVNLNSEPVEETLGLTKNPTQQD